MALIALAREQKRIIGSEALTAFLFNLPREFVERFRKQVTIIDLLNEVDPDLLRSAVSACYQEQPTLFRSYTLCDPGAYAQPPLSGRITWRVSQPQLEPKTEEERVQCGKLQALMNRAKKTVEERRRQDDAINY